MSHGLHRPVDDPSDLPAWQLVLPPDGRFTHLTAAGEYGWWLPPLPSDLLVFAAVPIEGSRPQRAGLRVSRHRDLPSPVLREDIRLDPPASTLLACARHLGVIDLVVLVDGALHLGACEPAELRAVAATTRKGAPALRRALDFADGRSESAWETLLRLLHVFCNVPVEPQYRVRDETGMEIARADLWLEGTNALHEYDGGEHLRRPRQRKDLARARRVGNISWVRRGYTSEDVLRQGIGILRDADLSLGREHRPELIRRWHRMLGDSLFTPSGQERFRRRIGLAPRSGGERRARPA